MGCFWSLNFQQKLELVPLRNFGPNFENGLIPIFHES